MWMRRRGHSGSRCISHTPAAKTSSRPPSRPLARQGVRALLLGTDTIFFNRRDQLIALAASHRIPAIYTFREYVQDGGLISYGPIQTETIRQAGIYTGRVLKGAHPGDLPVVQPTKLSLSSTSSPPRRSASKFQTSCSRSRTR